VPLYTSEVWWLGVQGFMGAGDRGIAKQIYTKKKAIQAAIEGVIGTKVGR